MCVRRANGSMVTYRAHSTCSSLSCARGLQQSIRKTTAVYCESGYRASLGASILKQEGFKDVRNVPGSWQSWKKAGFEIEGKISGE